MVTPSKRPSIALFLYAVVAATLGGYFTFAAIQGEYGIIQRLQVEAELHQLQEQYDMLEDDLAKMRNKTNRLRDDNLDLDLLDEQIRSTLGYIRSDEIIIP